MPALTPRVVWLAVTLLSIALHADAQNDNGRDSVSSYGTDSTITGGYVNEASGDLTFVGGGTLNEASGNYATVAGGRENTGSSSYSSVLGGFENTASDSYAFIGGGESNSAEGQHATIGGGEDNLATGDWAALPGGKDNTAGGQYAHVGGGQTNTADGDWAAIGGGKTNRADGDYASIGGGKDHSASADYATVAGGEDNDCKATHCFVGGGKDNRNTATYATISGGRAQTAKATFASIGGGFSNTVQATGFESTISGGRLNVIAGEQSVIGGGVSNVLTAGATIAGIFAGEANTAKGRGAIIVGGQDNEAGPDATFAFVGGGSANRALSNYTVIGGGTGNTVDGAFYATIAGGRQNRVDAPYAFVGGGAWNSVHSPWSAALGKGANVSSLHESALVLAFDKSGSCASMGEETVSVCAPNGMYLNGRLLNFTSGVASGTVEGGNRVTLHPSNSLSGTNASIGGGIFNTATGEVATIGGGSSNYAIGRASVVAGGYANAAAGVASAVVGGSNNEASGFESVVGGGNFNTAVGTLATVAGGAANTATSAFAFIGGGSSNRILAPHSAVLGSNASVRLGHGSSLVLGFTGPTGGPCVSEDSESVSVCAPNGLWVNGELVRTGTDALYEPLIDPSNNRAATWTTIGGGRRNAAFNNISTVGGGAANTANGVGVTIGGGLDNFASLPMSAISGGKSNTANAIYSFIGGGFGNLVDGDNGFVGGGEANLVHGRHGSVGGGKGNTIAAGAAMGVIGGGQLNSVLASYSYIPGGVGNTVASEYSLALGNFASNQHDGSGVFSFTSDSNNVCLSQNEDALSICATNGVYINGEYLVIADWALAEDLAAEASRNDKLQSAVGALNTSSAEHEVWLATLNSSSAALQADSATLATQVSALDAQGRARTMVIEDLEGNFSLMQESLSNVSLMAQANEMAVGSVEADVSSLDAIVVAEASRNDKLQNAVGALNTSSAEHEVWLTALNDTLRVQQEVDFQIRLNVSDLGNQLHQLDMLVRAMNSSTQAELVLNITEAVGQLSSEFFALSSNSTVLENRLSEVIQHATVLESQLIGTRVNVSQLFDVLVGLVHAHNSTATAVGMLDNNVTKQHWEIADLASTIMALAAKVQFDLPAQLEFHNQTLFRLAANASDQRFAISKVQAVVSGHSTRLSACEADLARSLNVTLDLEERLADAVRNSSVQALHIVELEHAAELQKANATWQEERINGLEGMVAVQSALIERLNTSLAQLDSIVSSMSTRASFVASTSAFDELTDMEVLTTMDAVDDTTHGPCNNNNIMPCELASTMSEADVAAANALAAFFARTGSNASAAEEVDAVSALLQFAENSAATSSDVSSTILAGIQNAAALLSSGGGSVNDETLTIFLDAVDGFAGWSGATGSADGITALDSALDSVCAAVSSSGSSSTTFQQETFSLSCGPANSTDTTVETDDVVVTIPGSTAGAVAVSSWSSDVVGSSDNSNVLVSNVIGVTVSGESSETDDAGSGFGLTIALSPSPSADPNAPALRASLSCKFWSEDNGAWVSRGVYLRGIDFDGEIAAAICVSSHLTLFAVEDDSAAVKLVDEKISALSQSFTALGDVDLLDADTEINPIVPTVFVGVTLAFVGVMVGSKCRNKKAATKQARAVYLQEGELTRPSVIRGTEFENILRGRFRLSGVAWLIFLDLITANNLVAMAFWWAHDHTVFTTADKAFLLYASVLSTFLACAFFFQRNVNSELLSDVDQATISVLDALISAAFANLLLFPVEYLVPFMITNVNSFSTGTPVPESIVRQQVRRIGRKLFPAVKRSDVNRLLRTGGPKPRRGQNRGVGARTRTAGNRKSPDHEPKSLEISAAGAVASVLSRPGFQRSISDARLVTAYAGEGKTAPSFESAKSMALWTQKKQKNRPHHEE
eukprot:INCI17281.2.p1 GENE.INCI17281.2~~INCI17281.2.p1  ORF type:complete len:1898 (+),score=375.03 INCI17281.2:151-5844(+)